METGTKISGGFHLLLIGVAMFAGPLFDGKDQTAIQVAEVSLVSEAEFSAAMSHSPAPETRIVNPLQPSVEDTANVASPQEAPVETLAATDLTEPQPRDEQPDLTAVAVPAAPPSVAAEVPILEVQPLETGNSATLVPDTAPQAFTRQPALANPAPRPAPRIASTEVPKPPTDAEKSEAVERAVEQEMAAQTPSEEKIDKAPQEAATEIVTEAEKPPSDYAPASSDRPRGRPKDLMARAQAAATQAAKDQEARDIAAAIATATADAQKAASPSRATAPSGPPLTAGEKEGLVLAVKECWNVPIGLENASDLVVVLAAELGLDGRVQGSPRLIDPAGNPQGAVKQAFEAGRRALLRCQPYDLPKEKFEQWRQIEVVFNPKKMVVK